MQIGEKQWMLYTLMLSGVVDSAFHEIFRSNLGIQDLEKTAMTWVQH